MHQVEIVQGTNGDEAEDPQPSGPLFRDLIDARWRRRDLLTGGLAMALASVFTLGARQHAVAETAAKGKLGFASVPVSESDTLVVPPGYRTQVILPWGTPTIGRKPAFSIDNTGEDQALQIGSHHDGLHYFPIDGASDDGLFVMNHEYVEPRFMHASAAGQKLTQNGYVLKNGKRAADEVLKEMNAHGVSITRIQKDADGSWGPVNDPRNRRITALTPRAGARHRLRQDKVQPRRHPHTRDDQQLRAWRDAMEYIPLGGRELGGLLPQRGPE